MYRVILWGTGLCFRDNLSSIVLAEVSGQIKVIGITSDDVFKKNYLGYEYIPKQNLREVSIDYIIIMINKISKEIITEIMERSGLQRNRIISFRPFRLPYFNFETYCGIVHSTPSIFANNCWGGITSYLLGLEFLSPFINMFVEEADYIKILENPNHYVNHPIKLEKWEYNKLLGIRYPVAKCDDVLLHFNHSTDYDKAKLKWEERKKRINWDNLFVMMFTEKQDIERRFAELPYKKKICFVPYQTQVVIC